MDPSFKRPLLQIALLVLPLLAAGGPALADEDLWVPQRESPVREAVYFAKERTAARPTDPAWTVRTGAKKGIRDRTLASELFAGPDAAVLRSGFYEPWPGLLAGFREPSVLVEPDRIAGLGRTKPYLIIPTNGLAGFASSAFFRAGLEAYVRSGGVALCFAQQTAADYAALPLPAGTMLEAAGAEQDNGPFMAASLVRGGHPALAGVPGPMPNIETSGYVTVYPPGSQVLLTRTDNRATVVAYPLGDGWIVVADLFPDFSADHEYLEPDLRTLLRGLVLWAKGPAGIVPAAPATTLDLSVEVRGPDQGEAAGAWISLIGPDGLRLGVEQKTALSLKANEARSVALSLALPKDLKPGIYHAEYVLVDGRSEPLSASIESRTGRFVAGLPAAVPEPARTVQQLQATPAPFRMAARWEQWNKITRLYVDLLPLSRQLSGADRQYTLRAAGQTRQFQASPEKLTLHFDIPDQLSSDRLLVLASDAGGRSLARLVVQPPARGTGITVDRGHYTAGDKVTVRISGMGKGELMLTGPGHNETLMIAADTSATFTLPAGLPAGVYPLSWYLQTVGGAARSGQVPLLVSGSRVRITGAAAVKRPSGDSLDCRFTIAATNSTTGRMKLWLRGPDGAVVPATESQLSLRPGTQDLSFAVPFAPKQAGIWELRYELSATLAAAPGLTGSPVVLAEGRTLFDAGNAALLGLDTARPVYYEAAGPVELVASVYGKGKARLDAFLDGDKAGREKLDLSGGATVVMPLADVSQGVHTVKAVLASDGPDSSREMPLLYGARLPDLTAAIGAEPFSGLTATVKLTVRNQGRSPAAPTTLALFDGDPDRGSRAIAKTAVPALAPDQQFSTSLAWRPGNRTGAVRLTALADSDQAVIEANEENNRASIEVAVPPQAIAIAPRSPFADAGQGIAYAVTAANLAREPLKNAAVRIDVTGPFNTVVSSETITLGQLGPDSEQRIDRAYNPPKLPIGAYRLQARLEAGGMPPRLSSLQTVTVRPTLKVTGTLDRTASAAAQCLPFAIEYTVRNEGNVPLSAGTVTVAIRPANGGAPVFTRQLPFAENAKPLVIESMDLAAGAYLLSLSAAATNKQYGITQEAVLAEQPLRVAAPVELIRGSGPLARVLVWSGRPASTLEQALGQSLVRQALADSGTYYQAVDTAEEFADQAATGRYNIFVLFEVDDQAMLPSWLQDRVARGSSLVLIGSGERSRTLAGSLGFDLAEASAGTVLTFAQGSGLSGSLPISGAYLLPRKKGAAALAANSSGEPLALASALDKGRVVLLPASIIRSARDAGTTPPFSLLLRSLVQNAAPAGPEQGAIRGEELVLAATGGPVPVKVTVTLPSGSKTVWTSSSAAVQDPFIRFEQTAGHEPRKLQFLYRHPDKSIAQPIVDLSYECRGTFVSGGRIE